MSTTTNWNTVKSKSKIIKTSIRYRTGKDETLSSLKN